MATTFDTLAFAERLKRGGFTDEQAKAATEAFAEATGQQLVTKSDLDKSIAELKADVFKWAVPLLLGQAGLITLLVKLL
ncbi:MAG: DUF1640 domain-containing protein [Geminicoccaceae bacterium]|nr:DUF1640 domain-containing protein [Geminicoccaceae bacterium]